ncbi:uncharacterized protein LOC107041745 [Diachasma alloeum]|uniref:uncharacterized protein LOC107041745 n=1 Tax=Diachasma alloeum TaxID=454923 RepID=UPI00073822A3|nr:uncharacterized protein LOC107041745 [Diachasma alloeum]
MPGDERQKRRNALFIFWNAYGIKNVWEARELLSTADVIGLSEPWLEEDPLSLPSWIEDNFHYLWSHATRKAETGRGSGGLLLLVKKEFEVTVLDVSKWWIFIRITLNNVSITVGNVYVPPFKKIENYINVMDILRATIGSFVEQFGDEPIILGDDFNGRIGQLNDNIPEELLQDTVLLKARSSSDKENKKEGCTLMSMMNDNCMFILNGRTPGDYPGQLTHFSKLGTSIVDFCWGNVPALELIRELIVFDEIFIFDHFPILLSMFIPELKPDLGEENSLIVEPVDKLKWKATASDEYSLRLEQRLRGLHSFFDANNENKNEMLTSCIIVCARDICMVQRVCNNDRKILGISVNVGRNDKWLDKETKASKNNVNRAWKLYKKNKINDDKIMDKKLLDDYYSERLLFKELVDTKKSLYFIDLRLRIANVRNIQEFWLAVKEVGRRSFGGNFLSKETWEEFYSNVYPPRVQCCMSPEDARHPNLDAYLSMRELESALKSLKNNKAPGPDLIPNEFWKALPPVGREYLLSLFNGILELGTVPESWPCAVLTMLHKKGPKEDPANYRDFEKYFREKGCRGININAQIDLMMPTYADDTALLCHSAQDVDKKLRILKEYCSLNGLVVNTSKTKVLPFRKSGRIRKSEKEVFKYDGKMVETVNQYEYLGVLLESNMSCTPFIVTLQYPWLRAQIGTRSEAFGH